MSVDIERKLIHTREWPAFEEILDAGREEIYDCDDGSVEVIKRNLTDGTWVMITLGREQLAAIISAKAEIRERP